MIASVAEMTSAEKENRINPRPGCSRKARSAPFRRSIRTSLSSPQLTENMSFVSNNSAQFEYGENFLVIDGQGELVGEIVRLRMPAEICQKIVCLNSSVCLSLPKSSFARKMELFSRGTVTFADNPMTGLLSFLTIYSRALRKDKPQ